MNKRLLAVFCTSLGLIASTAWLLAHVESIQRLGIPGVKVVPVNAYDTEGNLVGTNSICLPEKVLDYAGTNLPVAPVVLGWLPRDTTYGQSAYRASDGFGLSVNVVLMGADRTSIHKPQYCLTGVGWQIDTAASSETALTVEEPHRYRLPVMKLIANRTVTLPDGTKQALRGIYVYWFVADGQVTANHNQRMLWMARDMIRSGVLQRWAYVSCFAVCHPGQEDAVFERMSKFIVAIVPQFQLATGPPLAEGGEQGGERAGRFWRQLAVVRSVEGLKDGYVAA